MTDRIGFFSYAHRDEGPAHVLAAVHDKLQRRLSQRLGRDVEIYRDDVENRPGDDWRAKIGEALAQSEVLIAIITPSYLNSAVCREEMEAFLALSQEPGRRGLVIPIIYIEPAGLSAPNDPLVEEINRRHWANWTRYNAEEEVTGDFHHDVIALADHIHAQIAKAEGTITPPAPIVMPDLTLAIEEIKRDVSPNAWPIIEELIEAAREVAARPPETWDEEDILDLLALQERLSPAKPGEGTLFLPASVTDFLTALRTLRGEGMAHCDPGAAVPLSAEMLRLLTAALADLDRLQLEDAIPNAGRRAVRRLRQILRLAEASGEARLGEVSRNVEQAAAKAGDAVARGRRSLMAMLGQRPEHLPPHTIFTDSDADWAPEMVVIPEGRFMMGSTEEETTRFGELDEYARRERPRHEVRIERRFAMARFALTFDEYDAFCADTGCEQPGDNDWGRGRRPVIHVSWNDATAYCAWVSDRLGAPYRLPTEAEWEYACRAGTETAFSFGEVISTDLANYQGNSTAGGSERGEFRNRTVPVDHPDFSGNAFGLWQMHGNVDEWCEDAFSETYETVSGDGSPYMPMQGAVSLRLVRGGSWCILPQLLRSAYRSRNRPDLRTFDLGFRLARTLLSP